VAVLGILFMAIEREKNGEDLSMKEGSLFCFVLMIILPSILLATHFKPKYRNLEIFTTFLPHF
jgi:hypothetical protein